MHPSYKYHSSYCYFEPFVIIFCFVIIYYCCYNTTVLLDCFRLVPDSNFKIYNFETSFLREHDLQRLLFATPII